MTSLWLAVVTFMLPWKLSNLRLQKHLETQIKLKKTQKQKHFLVKKGKYLLSLGFGGKNSHQICAFVEPWKDVQGLDFLPTA